MANNVPPDYDNNPFVDDIFRFFAANLRHGGDADSTASWTYGSQTNWGFDGDDIYEGATARRPMPPVRSETQPMPKTGRTSSAAKYAWKRLTGGRHRHEAKARLLALQGSAVALAQEFRRQSEEFSVQNNIYKILLAEHMGIRSEAEMTLAARSGVVSLMHTLRTYDISVHNNFLTLDGLYRRASPGIVLREQLLAAHRAGIKRIVATMNDMRAQAFGVLANLEQLQEVYTGQYGRLPHAMSPAASLKSLFSVPLTEPDLQPLPHPDTLSPMPAHFRPGAQKAQGQARPEFQAKPKPSPYIQAEPQVAEGAAAADRIAPALEKIFAGDSAAWSNVQDRDLDAIEQALRHSTLHIDYVDSVTASVRRQVALKMLGDPEASAIRLRYRKRQMVVHPDKTGGLPKAARTKADAFCKILSAALDELTQA